MSANNMAADILTFPTPARMPFRLRTRGVGTLLTFLLACSLLMAQAGQAPAATAGLTLEEAVSLALKNYPAILVALEGVAATRGGVDLARTNYLPRTDFLWQNNRATRNNIFGLLLPQPVISGISGPAGLNQAANVWGSATGLMLAWEPFDFGLRQANVDIAESAVKRAEAGVGVTRLQVAASAADAFLTLVATGQTLRAATASVERARVFYEVVDARVKAGLRPGVDTARARAELALAENLRIQAEQGAAVARVALAQLVGLPAGQVSVREGPLLQLPPEEAAGADNLGAHPVAQEQNAAVEEIKARQRALERSYFPRFNLLANTYARGTGALTNGRTLGGINGLGPNIANWALGLNITFPVFELSSIRARQRIELHRQLAEGARYDRVLQDLNGQLGRARAILDGTRKAAQNTPFQLEAARATEQQATARYQAGLGTILEVADSQRLLTQAEIDDSLAKLNVWRGLLLVGNARGDLEPFLLQARR